MSPWGRYVRIGTDPKRLTLICKFGALGGRNIVYDQLLVPFTGDAKLYVPVTQQTERLKYIKMQYTIR